MGYSSSSAIVKSPSTVSPIRKKFSNKTKKNNKNYSSYTPTCPLITDDFLLSYHYSLLDGPTWSFDGEKEVEELGINTFGSNFTLQFSNFRKSISDLELLSLDDK